MKTNVSQIWEIGAVAVVTAGEVVSVLLLLIVGHF